MTAASRILICAALALLPASARAEPLVADLSKDLIAITTDFAGSDVLLFGATEGGGEVVVVVRGPFVDEVVRRKTRIAGVWVNRRGVRFQGVPSYYHLAASGPVDELLSEEDRQRLQIGHEFLRLQGGGRVGAAEQADYRAALVRAKQRQDLYYTTPGKVTFLGNRLFRTKLLLPANVPVGNFEVTVLLVRDRQVVAEFKRRLRIGKIGFEADVYRFAHQRSALYGLIAIVIALMAGWFAGFVFRKY